MQTQDIKRRIKSVGSTQQITRAMKFVAAAKLRRAQDRMHAMRPYAEAVKGLIKNITDDLVGDEHPIFTSRSPVKRTVYVVIAGDRGLCGGFNTTLLKAAIQYAEARQNVEPVYFAVGKQSISHLRKTKHKVILSYHDVFEKLSYVLAGDICEKLVAMFAAEGGDRVDEAFVVYNEFASMLTQRPVIRKIMPLDFRKEAAKKAAEGVVAEQPAGAGDDQILEEIVLDEAPDDVFDQEEIEDELMVEQGESAAKTQVKPIRPIYEFYPDQTETLDKLVSRFMATEIFRGMLESYAAELAARMTAMDNATANADEMISTLTLELNRARQSGITLELLDIVGGANALG